MIVTISWSHPLAGENNVVYQRQDLSGFGENNVVSDWFMIVTIALSYPLAGENNVVYQRQDLSGL